MNQVRTRNLKIQTAYKLPLVVRRLIEENKQRRIYSVGGGNFRGQLNKTTAYLRWKTACNTLVQAIGYIESELERERFYALYRMLFPKEWKNPVRVSN